MNQTTHKDLGLLPLPPDERDFKHADLYPTLGAPQIPNSNFTVYDSFTYVVKRGDNLSAIASKYGVSLESLLKANPTIKNKNLIYPDSKLVIPARPITILDQSVLDFCTGFASCVGNALIQGRSFDPLFQFAKIKQVRGEYEGYGASLRDACQALKNYGGLPKELSPFTIGTGNNTDRDRMFLANWNNWPVGLDSTAKIFKIGSYFKVDTSTSDAFDSFRSTLYLHRTERRGIIFGLYWRPEWTSVPGGIIFDSNYASPEGFPHCVLLVGQTIIKGIPYIILQNSWGQSAGDHGFYYFPRSVINKEARSNFGAFTFVDLSPGDARYYLDNGIKIGDNWIVQGFKVLKTFFSNLLAITNAIR